MNRWKWVVAGVGGFVVSSPAWVLCGDDQLNYALAVSLVLMAVNGASLALWLRRSGK